MCKQCKKQKQRLIENSENCVSVAYLAALFCFIAFVLVQLILA